MSARSPVIVACAWMSGSLISFMAMAIGGRVVSGYMGTFELLFWRSLIGLVIVIALLAKTGFGPIFSEKLGTHIVRNIAHFGGQFGWFYGIAFIPLAEVFALEFTLPVWTAILAAILLGEKITRPRILAIVAGLAGMLVILRPGFTTIHPAAMAVVLGALAFACSHTLTRTLALADGPIAILFYMTALQLPMGLVPALFDWVTPPPASWPWLLTIGVAALTAHYCMARALRLAEATVVVPMDFMRLPLIALVGFLFYQEPLDWFVLGGALLMLTGNVINIRAERQREP